MKRFSNRYMLLYSLGIAAVVALLLSVVAMGLKDKQNANVRNEKMQTLLATIGVECERDAAPQLYGQYFKEEITIESSGKKLPLFLFEKDGKKGYVIPAKGKGLWGGIYANIALDSDFNTIVGITFSHDSETPGLGAEITTDAFCKQFVGKKILDNEGKVVSVSVVKHADPASLHQVDAISGGTMTSNGVNDMLAACLESYSEYIERVAAQGNENK